MSNLNLHNLTIDSKKVILSIALNKININQATKDAFNDLYNLVNVILINSFTPSKINIFIKIDEMLIKSINLIHTIDEQLNSDSIKDFKFENILNLIDFNYITNVFQELNDEIGNMGLKLIDKLIKKKDKIIIVI